MSYIIAGLGNPGPEYEHTRHNAGRIIVDMLRKEYSNDDWNYEKKLNALIVKGKIGKEAVSFVAPETFMNNSGKTIGLLVKSVKAAARLVVVYDDFNLPLGRIRISFNRSSGGHNGLESVIKSVKTEAFARIRIGVAPKNAKGNAKTPHGDEKIEKFILGMLKDNELKELKRVGKKVAEATDVLVREGREKAMSIYNAG